MALRKLPTKPTLPKKPLPKKPVGAPPPLTTEIKKPLVHNLQPSALVKVFDIPIDDLVPNPNNPNEMDEATFDQFVQKVDADGFDEPIQVVPLGDTGKFSITGGHHRHKYARLKGMTHVPAVIKEGWSEDKADIELVARNMVKGSVNPEKFTELYNKLKAKGYDEAVLKLNLGFTKKDAFDKVYKTISKGLTPSQRKKLDTAKETITSVEGLSSTLNAIFKEHGSDLDHNFAVFQFGGKEHHYIVCDKDLNNRFKKLEEEVKAKGLDMTDVMNHLLARPDLTGVKPSPKVQERADKRTK